MITFFLIMIWVTFVGISIIGAIFWRRNENYIPILILLISIVWQVICGICGFIPEPAGSMNRIVANPVFENITYAEYLRIYVALVLGLLTTIALFIDYRYYRPMMNWVVMTVYRFRAHYLLIEPYTSDRMTNKKKKKKKRNELL